MPQKKIDNTLPLPVRQAIKELGTLIAVARKERRFTQAELARRVNVGRMTIVRMEKGAPEVAMGNYITAAWILGLPVFTWNDFKGMQTDSSVAAYLEKIGRYLPERVRQPKNDMKNDF